MRDWNELQEIEKLGEEEPEEQGWEEEAPRKRGGGVSFPLVQAAACALLLLALAVLKTVDGETYGRVTDWYRAEAAREIELPRWGGEEPPSTPSPAHTAVGALQEV